MKRNMRTVIFTLDGDDYEMLNEHLLLFAPAKTRLEDWVVQLLREKAREELEGTRFRLAKKNDAPIG